MEYSNKIAEKIEEYLKREDWTYEFDTIHGTFSVEADLSCQLKTVLLVTQLQMDSFVTYASLPVEANPRCCDALGEYLHRANYGLACGNFEMNYDDGEVHYKVYVGCGDENPTAQQIADSYIVPLAVVDHYGDGIVALVKGEPSTAQRLINAADNNLE